MPGPVTTADATRSDREARFTRPPAGSPDAAPRGNPFARPRRRRDEPPVARWRPGEAVAAVVAGVLLGQAVALGALLAIEGDDTVAAAGLVAADLVLLTFVVLISRRGAERLTAATLGIRRTPVGAAIGWGAAMFVMTGAVGGLLSLLGAEDGGAGGGGGGGEGGGVPLAAILLLVLGAAVTAPIVEEITFRGYLFPAVARWRGPWLAAVLTALLFGVAHVAALPVLLLPWAAAFGFGACLLYWFTGSLLPGVVLHSLNNAIAVTAATAGELWPAIFVAPVLSLLLLWPFARERAPHSPPAAAPAPS